MKNLSLILIILTSLLGCTDTHNERFHFDEVLYFVHSENAKSMYDCNTGETLEDFGCDIVNGSRPTSLADSSFIDSLNLLGYSFKQLDNSDFRALRNATIQKSAFVEMENLCEPIFRDILIFKNQGNITSIAKICFECDKQHSVDSTSIRRNVFFYNELQQILKNYR